MMRYAIAIALTTVAVAAFAADAPIATLRGPTPLTEQGAAPAMAKVSNEDLRRSRNYPEQPPTIPHHIRGYQIDMNANKCMSCHSRRATAVSNAPMVSIARAAPRKIHWKRSGDDERRNTRKPRPQDQRHRRLHAQLD